MHGDIHRTSDCARHSYPRDSSRRSPDDTPLRDGNRDRLSGLLTERAARTLLHYCTETNQHLHGWLSAYVEANPIPARGPWEDISGDSFLMGLLQQNVVVQVSARPGMDPLFDCSPRLSIDPRQVAQRIMDIRAVLAKEFVEDLKGVEADNLQLLRDCLTINLANLEAAHPESEEAEGEEGAPGPAGGGGGKRES